MNRSMPQRDGMRNGVRPLRVLLCIGRFRPTASPDWGEVLIRRVLAGRHQIACLVIPTRDRLAAFARARSIPVLPLPACLNGPLRRIRRTLKRDPAARAALATWLRRVRRQAPDVGVVFYGHWLPPALFNLPPAGFFNYHPAPLPELRGEEPDTFAILEGRRHIWGTIHRITAGYDEGDIVGRTRPMRIPRGATPAQLLQALTRLGIQAIPAVLDRTAGNRLKSERQDRARATQATRRRAYTESFIQWEQDSMEMLDRRFRAFAGQCTGIRLKARVGSTLRFVEELETVRGRFPGNPGELVGVYPGPGRLRGQPMIRTRDGIAVLRPGTPVPLPQRPPTNRLGEGTPDVRITQWPRPRTLVRSRALEGIRRASG